MSSEFQYSKVSECIWMDDGFQGLSLEGRYVWFYLLTNPAKKSMGIYRMPVAGMAAEAGMVEEVFRGALGEVVSAGMVSVDERKHVVVIWKYLVHNRPANGNIVRSWKGVVKGLPECDLVSAYLQWVTGYMAELGEGFVKGFGECLGNRFGNGIGKGIGNGTPTLLTLNSYLKTPLTPLEGGTALQEGVEGGEEDLTTGDSGDSGRGEGESGRLEGGKGEEGTDGTEGTEGNGEGGLRQDGAATGEGREAAGTELPSKNEERATSNEQRRRRRGGVGVDPLLGFSVLGEAHGVFRDRLVGVHGARATLVDPMVERGVLRKLVEAGFEERDVVAILKWVLWEEPVPVVSGGFCWRDQFRAFGGLVKPLRSGEWKFKGMAAAYEAWARAQGGVSVRAHGAGGVGGNGQGTVGNGQGGGAPRREEGPVRRWVAAG